MNMHVVLDHDTEGLAVLFIFIFLVAVLLFRSLNVAH